MACPFCLSGRGMKGNTYHALFRTSVLFSPLLFRNEYIIGNLNLSHKYVHGRHISGKGSRKNVCNFEAKGKSRAAWN